MAKTILDPKELGKALAEQMALYQEEVVEKVDAVGEASIKKLVHLTKKSAPKRTGFFAASITHRKHTADRKECSTFEWGVKAPHHRLTHLLVNGHPTRNGGRVPGDPFLENALDTVLPEYERDVEEALRK